MDTAIELGVGRVWILLCEWRTRALDNTKTIEIAIVVGNKKNVVR